VKPLFRSRAARAGGVFLCLALAAQSVIAQPAPPRDGQRPPPGEGPGGGRPNVDPIELLLTNKSLQAELRIEPDQLKRLKTAARELQNRQSEPAQQPNAGPEMMGRESQGAMRAHMEMGRAMISRVLNRKQLDRLQQVMMQVGGICPAMRDENVSRALALDPSQMRRIADACQRAQASVATAGPSGAMDVCAAQRQAQAREAARVAADAEVEAILSGGQVATLRALEGKPFVLVPATAPECQ